MKLKDLISKLYVTGRFVVTALAYYKSDKKYYSFRTIMDILLACYDPNRVLSELDDYTLNCEVRSINVHAGEVWIDIIEWIDEYNQPIKEI